MRIAIVVASFVICSAAGAVSRDWPSYNRTLTSSRYAPLDERQRGPACEQVADRDADRSRGAREAEQLPTSAPWIQPTVDGGALEQ